MNTTMQVISLPISHSMHLMIPLAAIAEIVAFSTPTIENFSPNWVLGFIKWRELILPLCAFEKFDEEIFFSMNPKSKIAIFNGTQGLINLPFYAVMIQGAPRVMHLQPKDVEDIKESIWWLRSRVASVDVLIPRLDRIEASLSAVMTLT